jgi:putative peptide zinc metalloprotease protein
VRPSFGSVPASDVVDNDEWMSIEPMRLAPEVEVMVGANDEILLFNGSTGRYVRISPSAARLLHRLDGSTASEITEALAHEHGVHVDTIAPTMARFFSELRTAEVLEVAAGPLDRRDKVVAAVRRLPLLRLPLVKRFSVLDLMARAIRPLGRPGLVATFVVALIGTGFGIATLVTSSVPESPGVLTVALVVAVLLVQIALHEVGHALACSLTGVPAREAGVGLLFYFLPIAYVDRTDSYRVRSRWARAGIAAAGPVVDGLSIGLAGLVVSTTSGTTSAAALMLLAILLVMFLFNLNPLLPTDTHQALEAIAGELNFRARAMGYALARLLRKPVPHFYRLVSARRRKVYLVYGAGSILYVLLLLVLMAGSVVTAIVHR